MQEFRDGSTGPIRPASELMKLLQDEAELERTASIHFGSVEELESLKMKLRNKRLGAARQDRKAKP
jgi:hypothetical protein